MFTKSFPIGEILRSAWSSFKQRFGFWCGVMAISIVLTLLPWIIAGLLSPEHMVVMKEAATAAGAAATTAATQGGNTTMDMSGQMAAMSSHITVAMNGDHVEMVKNFSPLGAIVGLVLMFVMDTVVALGWTNTTVRKAYDQPLSFKDYFRPLKRGRVFFSYLVGMILYAVIVAVGTLLFIFPGVIWGLRYSQFGYYIVRHGLGPIHALKASAIATMGAKWDLFGLTLILLVFVAIGFVAFYVGILFAAMIFRKLNDQTTLPPELAHSVIEY